MLAAYLSVPGRRGRIASLAQTLESSISASLVADGTAHLPRVYGWYRSNAYQVQEASTRLPISAQNCGTTFLIASGPIYLSAGNQEAF